MSNLSQLILFPCLLATSMIVIGKSYRRNASDVLSDLQEEEVFKSPELEERAKALGIINKELFSIGLLSREQQITFLRQERFIPICCILLYLLLALISSPPAISYFITSCLIAFGLGKLLIRMRRLSRRKSFLKSINFYLPLVMERLVMAVQSGWDIMPALSMVEETQAEEATSNDSVSQLLKMVRSLCESGLGFDTSLEHISQRVDSAPLRHAFVHLALSYREGGELVAPLKELSDSTQNFYQESIEEEIASLPVKATLPLLLVFAGLIICFITIPLLQIINLTGKVN